MDFQVKTQQCIIQNSILYNSHHHIIYSPITHDLHHQLFTSIHQQVIIIKQSHCSHHCNHHHNRHQHFLHQRHNIITFKKFGIYGSLDEKSFSHRK
jgi:hypothetical protein